jgi:hypothetical protein
MDGRCWISIQKELWIWGSHTAGCEEFYLLASLYSPVKSYRCFGGILFFHFKSACQFLAWLTFRPWRWRRFIPPKRRLIFTGLMDPCPRAYTTLRPEKNWISPLQFTAAGIELNWIILQWLVGMYKKEQLYSCCFYFSIQFKVKYRNVDDKFCVMNGMPCYCSNIQTR